jgi:hypothetical protein
LKRREIIRKCDNLNALIFFSAGLEGENSDKLQKCQVRRYLPTLPRHFGLWMPPFGVLKGPGEIIMDNGWKRQETEHGLEKVELSIEALFNNR